LNGPGDILLRAAQRFGHKVALVTATRTLSFVELDEASSALASSLQRRGIAHVDRVSILSANRWEWIVSYHGILKAGAVVKPLNVMLTDEEVSYATNDCGASAIFCEGRRAATLAAGRIAPHLRDYLGNGVDRVRENAPSVALAIPVIASLSGPTGDRTAGRNQLVLVIALAAARWEVFSTNRLLGEAAECVEFDSYAAGRNMIEAAP